MTDWSGGGHGYGGPNPAGGPNPGGGHVPGGGWDIPPPSPPQRPSGPPQQQWPSGPPQQQWPSGQPPQQQWPSGAPQQPPPGWQQPPGQQFGEYAPLGGGPRRNRKALFITIGAGVAVVLVVVIVAAIALVGRGSGGASDAGGAVQGYLEALAKGDAEAALSFGADQPASKELLSDEILKQQIEEMPISNIRILGDDSDGGIGFGQVHVTASFGDQTSDTTFLLKKNGDEWRLDSAAVRLDFSTQSSIKAMETVTAFGKPVGESVVYLFPGFVEWGSSNKNLTVEGKPVLLDALTGYAGGNVPEVSLSDAGRAEIVSNVKALLDECERSRSLEPAGCPQRAYEYGAVDGTVTWRAPDANDVEINFSPYDMSATVTMSGDFSYSVEGRDGARVTGTAPSSLFGKADLSKSPPTVEWN
ncbi:hypothetical protein [Mycobacterium sp.]|uniref:hypothetical protein n=1 Tax=Mycobacterium sp. TaxID=1785 RepID=UPI002DB2B679|nr:hypothetical protein [Mycobacterium sp.]